MPCSTRADDHFSKSTSSRESIFLPKQDATNTRTYLRAKAPRPDRRSVCPVLSCTAWGLPCPLSYPRGGELLPRHFTLTYSEIGIGGLISVALSVASPLQKDAPIFIGHAVVWCPDFPLPRRNQRSSPTRPRAVKLHEIRLITKKKFGDQ